MYWAAVGPKRFKFNSITHFCGNYFYKTNTDSMRYKQLRAEHIINLLKITLVMFSLMMIAYAIFFMIPIYLSYRQHIHVTPFATNLPFFEKDSVTEYIVNMIVQLVLCFVAMCGSYSIVIASCAIIHAIIIVPDLFRFNLLEFQDEWEVNGVTSTLMAQLRNSWIQLQDYQRYDTYFFGIDSKTYIFKL